jgi:[NiFe] hydrogenase small subunit
MQANQPLDQSSAVAPQVPFPKRAGGVSRREFLSFCSAVAAALGLGPAGVRQVQAALAAGLRPPVLWLHFSECTGCTESLLRTTSPYFDDLILNTISLEYHETLMVESGDGAENLRNQVVSKYSGDFLCVVEGSIPTANNGLYGTVGNRTMYTIASEVLPKAKAIIAIGSCASDGGLPGASPNPSQVRGVKDAFPSLSVPVVNCPGCPPNPVNFASIIVSYLLKGTIPPLDSAGRPTFAYGQTVHQLCALKGTSNCLQSKGCRGIATYHNCPQIKFNDGTSYCMQSGHVCIGCSEAGFWDSAAFWTQPFWKTYGVKVDSTKTGITYAGDPKGIVSTMVTPADAGAGGAGGSLGGADGSAGGSSGADARPGSGGSSGTGGSSTGGNPGSGGGTGSGGGPGSGSGGNPSSGGSSSGGPGSGGSGGSGGGGAGSGFGGSPGSGGSSGAGASNGHGCGCDVGGGGSPGILGLVTTAAALAGAATRLRHSEPTQSKGDACLASSSTPSPESKDT